jgi:two-component system, NtrC family, response regulator HydG
MCEIFLDIRRVAPHSRAVLITGAQEQARIWPPEPLHPLIPVSSGRYAVLNCSAVVETLFHSDVKGFFTGRHISTQGKLLRVLQNQEVQHVGSLTAPTVDVRVVAATNHNRGLTHQSQIRLSQHAWPGMFVRSTGCWFRL